MSIRARFYVSELKRQAYDPSALTVTLNAVSRGEENKVWATATPSGTLTMTIKNKAAADALADQLGNEVYLDITPAGD